MIIKIKIKEERIVPATITFKSIFMTDKSTTVNNTDTIRRTGYLNHQNPFHETRLIEIEEPELFGDIEIKATKAKEDVVINPSTVDIAPTSSGVLPWI